MRFSLQIFSLINQHMQCGNKTTSHFQTMTTWMTRHNSRQLFKCLEVFQALSINKLDRSHCLLCLLWEPPTQSMLVWSSKKRRNAFPVISLWWPVWMRNKASFKLCRVLALAYFPAVMPKILYKLQFERFIWRSV